MAKTAPATGPILNAEIEGEGQSVVLIHGLATSLRDWDHLVPDLLEAGFRVCRADLFGHGDSPSPGSPRLYNFKVVYGTLEEWIDSLDSGDPLLLVGHSMGGYMSLMYALRNSGRVRAMTLIDPLFSLKQLPSFMINTHRLSSIGAEMLRLAPGKLVDVALGRGPTMEQDFSPATRARIVSDVKRASPYILNIPGTLPDLTNELEKIDPPCQVIWGEHDGLLDPDTFPPMVSAMPFAIGHLIPGRGHQPHLENGHVNRLVIDFFNTSLLSDEEVLDYFDEEGEKLAWRYMLFEKYQTWFGASFLSKGMQRMSDVFEQRAVQRSLEQKKAAIMDRFETLLDELLEWRAQTLKPTPEQVEGALSEFQSRLGAEVTDVLLDRGEE